jgi:hypothetical protein
MPPVPTPDSYPGTPGETLYAGIAAPSVGASVATLTLHNTSGSTQAAGFVSPLFGASFKQGDIAAGTRPVFKTAADADCPATFWLESFWPDGSLKQAGCMILVPTSIPGSGSIEISVNSDGSIPSAGSRTTAEVSAANLSVELVGSSNLSGTWTATPADGISDGSDMMLLGSGPAGSVWWIGSEVRQGGTAHGQLYAWHGVAALSGASNELLGLRHFHQISQPFIDEGGATCTTREMTATLKRGASTIRTVQAIPPGRGAAGTTVSCAPYSSFDTLGADGKWDYTQGGGTAAADCTVRVVWDKTDRARTRLIPPYDISATVNDASVVDHVCYGNAGLAYDVGGTGERPDIGVLPTMAARYFINPTANAERHLRAVGLAALGWRVCMRNRATRQIAPATNPSASYTGLAAPNTTMYALNGQYSGVNAPAASSNPWSEETETHHIPSTGYAAWIVTGEPQYLFSMMDQASHAVIHRNQGGPSFKTALPITSSLVTPTNNYGRRDTAIEGGSSWPGGYTLFLNGGSRIGIWMLRTIAQAAAMIPPALPNGAQAGKYIQEVTANSLGAYNEYNNLLSAGHRSGGIHFFDGFGGTPNSPWMVGYGCSTLAHASQILGSTASAAARQHLGRWLESAERDACVQLLTAYRFNQYSNDGKVEDPEEVLYAVDNVSLSFAQSTGRVTVGGSNPFVPSNGDCIAMPSYNSSGGSLGTSNVFGAVADQRVWFVNVSGQTAQISLTKGGAPVAFSGDQVVTTFNGKFSSYAYPYMAGNAESTERLAAFLSYARTHVACGDTNVADAMAALEAAATAAGGITGYASDPKHLMMPSYPV